MILKFLKSTKSRGATALEYCLDNERHKGAEPRILKGDENATRAIIANCPYKNKATFGVLSFSESADSISDQKKLEIIADFERNFIGDFMRERVNIIWIEHTDKGRLELNFIIPNIDLVSGKNYAPYTHQRDKKRKELWAETINAENGFSSPRDPERERLGNHNSHNKRALENLVKKGDKKAEIRLNRLLKKEEFKRDITEQLLELVKSGVLNSRDEILECLKKCDDIQIIRTTAKSISIKHTAFKTNIRLDESEIFNEQFTDITAISEICAERIARTRAWNSRDTREISAKNRRTLAKYIEFINAENRKRFENPRNHDRKSAERVRQPAEHSRRNQGDHLGAEQNTDERTPQADENNEPRADENARTLENGAFSREQESSQARSTKFVRFIKRADDISRTNEPSVNSRIFTKIMEVQNDSIRESIARRIREQERIRKHNSELNERKRKANERKRRADESVRRIRERETAERERIRERIRNELESESNISRAGIREWIENELNNSKAGIRKQLQEFKNGISETTKRIGGKFKERLREYAQARDEFLKNARERRAERERKNSANIGRFEEIAKLCDEGKLNGTRKQLNKSQNSLWDAYHAIRDGIQTGLRECKDGIKECDNRGKGRRINELYKEFVGLFGEIQSKIMKKQGKKQLDKQQNEQNLEVEQEPISRFKL